VGFALRGAAPGGNVTGVATIGADLGPKRLELLKELMPAVRRVGIIGVKEANSLREIRDVELAAQGFGFRVHPATLSDIGDAVPAIDALLRADAEVILLTQAPLLFNARKRLLAQAAKVARPVIAHRSEFAEDGALASYGPSLAAQLRRSAAFVDRVLRGSKPAELPIERPATFELVVNLGVARAFRLAVPNSVLLRADRTID
jgi:putative ABC transport system substrate-binding protein